MKRLATNDLDFTRNLKLSYYSSSCVGEGLRYKLGGINLRLREDCSDPQSPLPRLPFGDIKLRYADPQCSRP